jgi:peptidoglycan L-alanyl-D-glutamate endopeptidase CwlK
MLKVLLILPKRWKTLDERVKNLETYLSRKDRLGSIYGQVRIDTLIATLPQLTLNSHHVYNQRDIMAITKPHHGDYDAVGVVFPVIKGEKYAGNYYPNTGDGEYKMDFYIKADEKTKQKSGYWFEEFVEHELAGHAVALDLGLANQGTDLGFKEGADNTHHFFYGNDKEGHYAYVNTLWKKKASLFSVFASNFQKAIDSLKKKTVPSDNKLEGLTPRTRELAEALIAVCFKAGKEIRVTEGYRSCERQNELYAQGRTTPGPIVTNARCGQSNHQKGTAFDVVFRKGGYNVPESQWQWVGQEGKKLGLKHGGDWKFKDNPHFEL